MKMINLVCEQCGKEFIRNLSEHIRTTKLNRKIFCSRHCAGLNHARFLPIPPKGVRPINFEGLPVRVDEFSPFRKHLASCKTRSKECVITLQDLKNQWDKQKGICPYSGKTMRLVRENAPDQASLDRIDSSKGYTVDNIQFVCLMMQYAKNGFTDQQIREFLHV